MLAAWIAACAPRQMVQGDPTRGERRFGEIGCNGCHSVAGVGGMVGPDLSHLASRALPEAGRWSSVAEYLLESLREPQAYLVLGYPGDMPAAATLELSDRDVEDLVAYLLTLR
ncbi:MAG: c-type cytochrome [Gemmatimonadales bacterium]